MLIQINPSLLKASLLLFTSMFIFNAQAGTLNSTLDLTPSHPDITSENIVYTYDVANGEFEASGNAMGITYDLLVGSEFVFIDSFVDPSLLSGTFNLDANINKSAGTADGILNIGGTITSLGFNSGTLITATLAQVGGPNMALNFLFNVTGGDAASLYGGIGSTVGVIMNTGGYLGITSFDANFNGTASSDTFAVPSPNSFSVFLIGFIALGLRKKLRG